MNPALVLLAAALAAAGAGEAAAEPSRLAEVRDAYPHPSPDGARVVFHSNRSGAVQLWSMNGDGSGLAQLTDGPGASETPKFAPDGRRIVYTGVDGENTDIWVMSADGSGRRRLTDHPGDDSHPSWSADGQRIIFNSARTTPDLSVPWNRQWHEVFSMRPDGSDLVQHTRCESVCTYPSFSPDGRHIAYRKVVDGHGLGWDLSHGERDSEVFVARIDGSGERNLSNSAAFDGWPAFSPDGTRVVFASNRAGPAWVGQLYAVNVDGSGLERLTSGPWSYVQPAWSADGSRLYAYQNQENEVGEFGALVVIQARKESAAELP